MKRGPKLRIDRDQAVRLLQQGRSLHEVARILSCAPQYVSMIAKAAGIDLTARGRPPGPEFPSRVAAIIKARDAGETYPKIAKTYQITPAECRRLAITHRPRLEQAGMLP